MPIALLAAALIQTAPSSAPADLSWISGYWLECLDGREVSETWSDPRAGLMVGHSLSVSALGQASFEMSRIGPTPNGLAFIAQPDGAPPVPFVMVEAEPNRAVFQNLEHDFPTRVIYRRFGETLHTRIEGRIDGEARSMEWTLQAKPLNTRCPR